MIGATAMAKNNGLPTDERLGQLTRHEIEIGRDARGRPTLLTIKDAPVDRMQQRGKLSTIEYWAAVRYRRHWYLGGLAPVASGVDPNRIYAADFTSFGHMAKTESQADHRKQYRDAREYIGPMPAAILEHVICIEYTLERLGAEFGFASKSKGIEAAETYVRRQLTKLAKHWDLREPVEGKIRSLTFGNLGD